MAKKKKNPYAKELMTSGKYKPKTRPSKKKYDRKKTKSY